MESHHNGQSSSHLSQLIGMANEARVVKVLNDPGWFRRPPWFIKARLASKEEDHAGTDVVIETAEHGPVKLQVKSSDRRAQVWKRQHPNTTIVLIVVRSSEEDLVLRQRIMELITKSLRQEVEEVADTRRMPNRSRRRR